MLQCAIEAAPDAADRRITWHHMARGLTGASAASDAREGRQVVVVAAEAVVQQKR